MEAATTSPLKALFATSIPQLPTHSSTASACPPSSISLSKPIIPSLHSSNPFPRNKPHLFLSHCSTKPDTNTNTNDDFTGQASTFYSNGSNPTSQHSPTPLPSDQLSSPLPSPSLSRGLVLDLGPADSWDCNEIGSPVVKRFLSDEEERWYMWYHGNSGGSDSIGLAVSSNGIHWERGLGPVFNSNGDVGLVMNRSDDWWAFDTMSIRPSEMIIMSSTKVRAASSVYWLYYTGFSSESLDLVDHFNLQNPEIFCKQDNGGSRGGKVFKSLPGLAMSQDGRHWARIEGEHHSGALFDVGSEKEWDSLFIAGPQVVFHGNGDLRMYYHSFDKENGEFGIGIARSRDGMKLVKLGKIMGGGEVGSFDELGVKNPCVVVVKKQKDKKYVMAYEGIGSDGKRSIGLAVSHDGLKEWRRFQEAAVLKPSEDGWDDGGVGCPCLVQMGGDGDDEWRLYYRGHANANQGRTGIGMAVSNGSDISSFRRWSRIKL